MDDKTNAFQSSSNPVLLKMNFDMVNRPHTKRNTRKPSNCYCILEKVNVPLRIKRSTTEEKQPQININDIF